MYEIDTLFQKHISIFDMQRDREMYKLPGPETMFKESPWQRDDLQTLKKDLNEVKNRLNDFNQNEWQKHTNNMNKAGFIVNNVKDNIQPQQPLVTQAWCKFYEIAHKFSLIPLQEIRCQKNSSFASIHLCEAPGAFVVALNYWLKKEAADVRWDWLATTLNPYCEENSCNRMISDDRYIRHTLKHWCFGADNTGDIMDPKNLDALVKRSKSMNRILFVTADGSVDCTDQPGEQESFVAQLHLCETIACMHLLHQGGNFLLKVFTLFEHQSVCLMYLLSCVFHKVIITKPVCSKAGNSEIYVICINFKGKDYVAPYLNILRNYYGKTPPDTAMFDLRDISSDFLQRIQKCNEFFKNHQCQTIEDNINMFGMDSSEFLIQLVYVKKEVCRKYFKNCKLKVVSNKSASREKTEKNNSCFGNKKLCLNSYNERCKMQNLKPEERLLRILDEAKDHHFIEPSIKSCTWQLSASLKTLKITTGKFFNKINSSRFCDQKCLQILNEIDNTQAMVQNTHFAIFPPVEVTKELMQQIDASHEILIFRFVHNYDSHQTIKEIYDRLKKLQNGQTLILVGYSLLTQLNVGLLYLLGNSFKEIIVEVCDNEGYHIKLKTYRRNKEVLKYWHKISIVSENARKENKMVWSIIPITILYECEQFDIIMHLNHLMIKSYAHHIIRAMMSNKK